MKRMKKVEELLDLPPDQRMKAVLEMSPEEQRVMTDSLQGDKRDEFLEGMNPRQRETIEALNLSTTGGHQRTRRRQIVARHLQRSPAAGSDDRLLVQSL